MSDLGRINREIKDAMKRFINNDDETSLHSIIALAKERQKVLIHRSFKPSNSHDSN